MTATTIIRRARNSDVPFFIMSRPLAQDRGLSFEARGVMAYLLSKPDDWKVQPHDLEQLCGKTRVYRILKELRDGGYVELNQLRDGAKIIGWEYVVHEIKQLLPQNQEIGFQELEKQELENGDITEDRVLQSTDSTKGKKKEKPVKGYEDVAHEIRTAIITAWQQNLSAPPIGGNAYANTNNHKLAAAIARAGYTADDVRRYTAAMQTDMFWHDKPLKLKNVADNLPAWVKAHPAAETPSAPANPDGEVVSPEKQEEARRLFEQLVAAHNANTTRGDDHGNR